MSLKVGHWTLANESGMNQVAKSMVEAERKLGLDSHICNIQFDNNWDHMRDCDIHVSHTHFPDVMRKKLTKPLKLVWVGHGTPEHVIHWSYQEGQKPGWGHGDSFMLMQYWMKEADAVVTFWERHAAIYRSMLPRQKPVHVIPMGVDLEFWGSGESQGKYAGTPSVFSAENPHTIKWPLDLIIAWPWVYPELDGASLHLMYLTQNLHRWFAPLMNANGASYAMHWGPAVTDKHGLRNIHKSTDFYVGLVQKGDFNRMSLEANAAGASTISYTGNPYSHYWIPEGDQREIAKHMVAILKDDVEPRADRLPVPDHLDTARAMMVIYESIA